MSITDTQLTECPVGYITPQSFELVQIHFSGSLMKDLTGAVDFGPDSSTWDARHYDALSTIAMEDRRVEREIDETREMYR